MDIIGLISSVSRLAIAAFVITLAVVAYEVFLISRRKRQTALSESHDVAIPEFSAEARPGTFSPIVVDEVAKNTFSMGSRRIPRSQAYVLLGLGVLLVAGAGFLIYKRSTLFSPDVKISSVKPTQVQDQARDTEDTDLLKGSTDGGVSNLTPSLTVSRAVTPTPTGSVTPSVTPSTTPVATVSVPTGSPSNNTVTPSPTLPSMSPTPTVSLTPKATSTISTTPIPTTQNLPQAGTYQNMLVLSLVSIAVIYLALIL